MQRVHEGLAYRLVQRGLRKQKSSRERNLARLCTSAGILAGNDGTDRPKNASLRELEGNVAANCCKTKAPSTATPNVDPIWRPVLTMDDARPDHA